MKKKNLLVVVVVSLSLMGCMFTKDISGRADYAHVIGAKYALNRDCYVLRDVDQEKSILVGSPDCVKGVPEDVGPQYINHRFGEFIILGVLKKGAVFTIVGAEEEKSPVQTAVYLKATFEDSLFKGRIVDVFLLTDTIKSPPVFDTNLVSQLSN